MTSTQPRAHRSAPRRRVALAGVLLAIAGFGAVLQLVALLRHPLPGDVPVLGDADWSDPRIETVCPEQQPVEGGQRQAPRQGPAEEARTVTSADLYDCPESWHMRRVRYRGEAVGAILRRDDGAWIRLNDDVYAGVPGPPPEHRDHRGGNAGVGVHVPLALADEIERVGGPGGRGDLVEVVGRFLRVDPVHAEVAVIAAESASVVAPGEPRHNPLLTDRLVAATALGLLAAVVVLAERLSAHRRW